MLIIGKHKPPLKYLAVIEDYAFAWCRNLREVVLSDGFNEGLRDWLFRIWAVPLIGKHYTSVYCVYNW